MDGAIAFVLGLFIGAAAAVLWIGLMTAGEDEKSESGRR